MIEHDRHRRGGDEVLDRRDHREIGEELDMPAAPLDALDRGLKARAADIGIVDAAGGEIEPDAADARLVHGVEVALRRLVVDHGDAAGGRAAGLHPKQGRGIVGAIDAWRDDHHALDVQGLVQRRHLLGRRQFRGVDAPFEERKFGGVAMDVGVAIAGARGNVEIHRRRRLRRGGKNGSVGHGYSGRDGSKQNTASRQHGLLPCAFFVCWRSQNST